MTMNNIKKWVNNLRQLSIKLFLSNLRNRRGIKASEQLLVVVTIENSTKFSATVHSELCDTNVNGVHGKSRTELRSDSGPARTILSHNELLVGDVVRVAQNLGHSSRKSICSVPAVGIDLQNDSLVHLHLVELLMFRGVVGVHWMSHVSTDQKWTSEHSQQWITIADSRKRSDYSLQNSVGEI